MKFKRIKFLFFLLIIISMISLFALAQGVGYIQIKCEPGAIVFLDNRLVGNTTSELGGLILQDVPAGSHEVKIVKEGYNPQSVKIDLKENEIYLYEVSLKQKIGALLVETIPIDCIIEIPKLNIDKEHKGNKTKPTWEVSAIPIGSYKINFIALGKKVKYDLKIEEGTRKHLLVNILKNEVKELLPILTWDRTYGGSGEDWAFSLIQTADGGYAVAGLTSFKGAVDQDLRIIKLDNQGNLLWDRTYGSGSSHDGANSLIQTTDGGYALAGYTYSKGASGEDFWLIKLDNQGNLLWERTYGGSGGDVAYSLIQTTDGGYAVAGGTSSKGAGKGDFWVIKLDKQGNKIWDRTYGGSGNDGAKSLIQTSDGGGYALAGLTSSKGAVKGDFWVIKLDNQGNLLWDRTYGGGGLDMACSLVQTTDGGYAVAGYTESKGAGGNDFWVIKLDEQGNLIPGVSNLDYEAQTETETNYFLEGSLHCSGSPYPPPGGYPCDSCSSALGYDNHFKGFNVLTTNDNCYVKLTYNNGDYIGNQNDCEVTITGEKWLGLEGLENESGTKLVEEINSERFNFKPANKFVKRTMNFPGDNYKYEFANNGKEFRLYLSRNREEAFKAVPWRNVTIEIKNKETNKVFKYTFEKGIFPLAYSWSNGVANYGQCVWWTAKRWVEEVDSKTLFPFYPPSPQAVNVIKIDSNYQPKRFDILIDYKPGKLGHYGFVERVDGNKMYISQFNFIPPGEVYSYVLRTWNRNATNLYYSNFPHEKYYFKYYYRK